MYTYTVCKIEAAWEAASEERPTWTLEVFCSLYLALPRRSVGVWWWAVWPTRPNEKRENTGQ